MARFKTRARAIDMLGRQQISGIPTAISELFKNAHDAYADRVEVDYYREDKLFVLRDDGLGMTKEEFETRWLTLGTESKLGAKAGMTLPPRAPGKAERPVLGEKGIGRLAIAAIGSHVLIVTRAKRGKVLHDTVVCYIHWGIFEQPGIDLDEIEIPIRTFPDGTLPDEEVIGEMLDEFASNLDKLKYLTDTERAQFKADFASTRLSVAEVDSYVAAMSLTGKGHGTHFIIAPASPLLEADMAGKEDEEDSSFDQALLGFTNTMTTDDEPAIKIAFRDHLENGLIDDKILPGDFFTTEEFSSADHHFQGEFDEFGQFKGTVSVYKRPDESYPLAWDGAGGKKTRCGPFKLKLAYLQGNFEDSTLPLEEYNNLKNKTNKLGGLYIYKNGIRILPYGNTTYDWLDIEQRRSKKASRYFFAHRRMFGAVEIDQTLNSELSEKAGREGFRENKAFREFKSILINFFLNLATDHFRESGVYSDEYFKIKTELQKAQEDHKKREQQSIQKRKAFAIELQKFEKAVDNGEPQQKAESLLKDLRYELQSAGSISDRNQAAQEVLRIEYEVRQQVQELEESYKIAKPRVAINASLERGYNAYVYQNQKLTEKTFKELRDSVESEISQVAQQARLALDRRVRIGESLSELAEKAKNISQNERKQIITSLESIEKWVRSKVNESVTQISNEVRDVLSEFNSIDFTELEETDVLRRRNELESRIINIGTSKQGLLQAIRVQLERVKLDESIAEQVDEVSFLEQRLLTLEEQDDEQIRLSQLGMAVEIISHEFESTIHDIRNGLRYLKGWADLNPGLDEIYTGLRVGFEHLDTYLSLFTPQQRRLYRHKALITGSDISNYISSLFNNRFERHEVEFKVTSRFNKQSLTSYLSSLLPVFVNLTDNAIYWLKDKSKTISGRTNQQQEPRIIEFHAEGDDFLVSNNGTELLPTYYEAIFENGVSHKPGGRGLGLAISRESLQKIDYTIEVDEIPRPGMSITFRISPKK